MQALASCPVFASMMKSVKLSNKTEMMMLALSSFNFASVLQFDRDMVLVLEKPVPAAEVSNVASAPADSFEPRVSSFLNLMMVEEE